MNIFIIKNVTETIIINSFSYVSPIKPIVYIISWASFPQTKIKKDFFYWMNGLDALNI